ncbi:MAG: hypothetical protein K9M82_01325 [Deltaproteobacteria bacterium]|nr:hypothetical protein [Deltaproteobacteria bacterium]
MPPHSKLLIHRNSESVHLKPMGVFGPGSARELIDHLERFSRKGTRLFIHTNGLEAIDPAGIEEYRRRMSAMHSRSHSVVYTGENRDVFQQ